MAGSFDLIGNPAELFPIGGDKQGIAALHGRVRAVVITDLLEQVIARGVEVLLRLLGGQRIIGADRLDAQRQQAVYHLERRRVADVVRMLLERQSQQGHRLLVEAEMRLVHRTINQVAFLKFIDLVNRAQEIGRAAATAQLIGKRLDVLAKTAAPCAIAHIGTPGANALVGGDAKLELRHVNVIERFRQATAHAIPERDVGQKQRIGDVLDGLGRLRSRFDVADAHMVDELRVDMAQHGEIFAGIRAHHHAIRLTRALDGIAFRQKLRVGSNAKVGDVMFLQYFLQLTRCAHRHGAFVDQHHAALILAVGQKFGQLMGRFEVEAQVGRPAAQRRGREAKEDDLGAFQDRLYIGDEEKMAVQVFCNHIGQLWLIDVTFDALTVAALIGRNARLVNVIGIDLVAEFRTHGRMGQSDKAGANN